MGHTYDTFDRHLFAQATRRYHIVPAGRHYSVPNVGNVYGVETGSISRAYEIRTLKHSATWRAQNLPGCCGVLVLSHFSGDTLTLLTAIQASLNAARTSKYGQVVWTLRDDSALAQCLPQDDTWVFRNGKTGHLLRWYAKIFEWPVPPAPTTHTEAE